MHLQRVAFGRHRPPVCMSRLRIVHIPIHQMIRIRGPKLRPNHQPTQRPSPQRGIRVLRIDRRRRRRLKLHNLHAALRPTRIHPHHRPRSRLPIPIHPTRRISKPTPPNHRQNPKPSHHLSDASTVQTCLPEQREGSAVCLCTCFSFCHPRRGSAVRPHDHEPSPHSANQTLQITRLRQRQHLRMVHRRPPRLQHLHPPPRIGRGSRHNPRKLLPRHMMRTRVRN